MSLTGKIALVTGGGTGAGAAIAQLLAEQGACVHICGRNLEPLKKQAARNTNIIPHMCDIIREEQVVALFENIGTLDIVIANAGAAHSAPFAKTSYDNFMAMLDVNLKGTFLTLREGAKAMLARENSQSAGRLIAIASTAALKGYTYVAPYAAAKHGVLGMIRSIALEYAKKNITANAICPSFLDSEMTQRSIKNIAQKTGYSLQEARATLEANIPMGQLISVESVAQAVLWLCNEHSQQVTGQAISIAGGEI